MISVKGINRIEKYTLTIERWMLFLLIGGIAISPSFSIGSIVNETNYQLRNIEVRLEDFVLAAIVVLAFIYFLTLKKTRITKPPLWLPICAWLIFGFVSLMINGIIGNVSLFRSLLFFGKEVEFFILYFATFYLIRSTKTAIFALKTWIFFTFLNVLWVITHFSTPTSRYYYYGPTLFAEPSNPFASGAVFLTIELFFVNLLMYYYLPKHMSYAKKIGMIILLLSPFVGIVGSGSQTAGIAFAFGSLLLVGLLALKARHRRYLKYLTGIVLVTGTIITLVLFTNSDSLSRQLDVNKITEEFSLSVPRSRANIWMARLLPPLNSPLATLIGFGKSIFGESHNQFIRNFAETGIIGSLLFIILIYTILKTAGVRFLKSSDTLVVALSAGLFSTTISMILVSIPAESFIYSVKLSETFWSFAGITMAVLYRNRIKPKADHDKP